MLEMGILPQVASANAAAANEQEAEARRERHGQRGRRGRRQPSPPREETMPSSSAVDAALGRPTPATNAPASGQDQILKKCMFIHIHTNSKIIHEAFIC